MLEVALLVVANVGGGAAGCANVGGDGGVRMTYCDGDDMLVDVAGGCERVPNSPAYCRTSG